jgi:hypothetical protein
MEFFEQMISELSFYVSLAQFRISGVNKNTIFSTFFLSKLPPSIYCLAETWKLLRAEDFNFTFMFDCICIYLCLYDKMARSSCLMKNEKGLPMRWSNIKEKREFMNLHVSTCENMKLFLKSKKLLVDVDEIEMAEHQVQSIQIMNHMATSLLPKDCSCKRKNCLHKKMLHARVLNPRF